MALCEQCGSISIGLAQQEPADKLLGIFSKSRPFICRRCGWRGRRDWTDEDLLELVNYGAGGAEPDPALAVLDDGPSRVKPKRSKRRKARSDSRGSRPAREKFDLGQLDLANAPSSYEPSGDETTDGPGRRPQPLRPRSVRRRNSRKREVIAAIAVSALVMFLVAIVGLTGSCAGSTDAL